MVLFTEGKGTRLETRMGRRKGGRGERGMEEGPFAVHLSLSIPHNHHLLILCLDSRLPLVYLIKSFLEVTTHKMLSWAGSGGVLNLPLSAVYLRVYS